MVRSLSYTAALLLVCATTALAQKKPKEAKPGEVELIRLENGWAAALVARDRDYFERRLAPKFVYTEDDRLMRRADVIHDLVAGTDTVTAAHNEDMEVHQFGAEAAAVTGWLIVEGRGKSGAFKHRYRFTDTWVKRKAGWQIAAAQDYLAPK